MPITLPKTKRTNHATVALRMSLSAEEVAALNGANVDGNTLSEKMQSLSVKLINNWFADKLKVAKK